MLPAGTAFQAKLVVPKGIPVHATLSLWHAGQCPSFAPLSLAPPSEEPRSFIPSLPSSTSLDKAALPPDAITLAMVGDSVSTGELVAEVPPLQFGLAYCLRLEQRRGLTELESNRAVRPTVADPTLSDLLRTSPVIADALGRELAKVLRKTLTQNGIKLADGLDPSLEDQMSAVARDYLSGAASQDYLAAVVAVAAARDTTLKGAQQAITQLAQSHKATIDNDKPRQVAASFLLIGDTWFSPKQFWASARAPGEIVEAQAYLRALRQDARLSTQTAILDEWISALELAKTDFAAAKAVQLKAFTPGVIGVWDGAKILSYDAFVDGAQVALLDGALLRRAAVHLREHDVQHKQRLSVKLQGALVRLAGAIDRLAAADKELEEAQAREVTTKAAAQQALVTLVSEALQALRVQASFASAAGVRESTPQAANYASVDLGVAVGMPFTKDNEDLEALWMPYLGVNLYFFGVDRNIPLSRQRGGFWRTRFALTLGFGLDEPKLAGRELEGFLFGKIPLIAVGARVSQYSRVSVGAMFYEWPDDSPAEDDSDFGGALFLGYSLDLDLVKWIRGEASGYGGL